MEWNRKEYENAAEEIASKYMESKGAMSLNKLAEDVSRTASLNPDGIRTMVRLANVSVFEKLFAEKTGEDKMIEYEPGDAEVVINNIYTAEKTACEKHLVQDVPYDQFQDYYGDLTPMTKVANAEEHYVGKPEDRIPSRQELKHVVQRAREKLAEEKVSIEHRWIISMEKLADNARLFVQTPAERVRFEKLAVAALGEQVIPELRALNSALGVGINTQLFGGEKLADVLDRFTASPSSQDRQLLDFIEGAKHARVEIKRINHGVEVLDEKLARI
jgi:hypothetical protein